MAEIVDAVSSIVLLGRINPLIFQPAWLAAEKVIGENEASQALKDGIEVIHPEVASIQLANKKLVVESNKYSLSVSEEPFVQGKDFTINCFRLLPHTPCSAMGINFWTVFSCKSERHYHLFGDLLAPKVPWKGFVDDCETARTGGLRAIVMERNVRADERRGYIRVTVEAVDDARHGIKVSVNDHYVFGEADQPGTAEDAMRVLKDRWEPSFLESQEIIQQMIGLADA